MELLKRVFLTIESADMIRPGETVLAAVSGGADSVAMLHLLREIETIHPQGWRIVVGHVNHRLRGAESDEDERFVRALARRLGLEFRHRSVDVAAYRARVRVGLEEAARKLRRRALREMALDTGAKKIALAHTMDDQAETILHRIIRGSGLRGIRGMAPIRRLSRRHELFAVRPLIEVEREALRRYLSDRGIEWREDASNADTTHLRNRLRHRLIPLIESEYNPRFRRALVRLGQVSAAFYLLVREIAGELYENVKLVSRPGEVCLSVEEFAKLPVPIQTLVVDRALQELRGVVPQLTFEHYMDLVALCHEGGDGKRIVLPRGLEAARDRYVLRFAESRSTEEPGSFAPVPLRVPGATPLRELGILIETEVLKGKVVGLADYIRNKDTSEEILDYDRVEGALVVRPRQEGDYFHPLGGPGRSKLRKFLIDVKVPRAMRARIPILADERKIVCVLGYRISEEVRVTEATRRVLRLRVRRAE